jgi:rubrerythrin
VDERDSLFSLKQYYLDRFIKIIADDDKLKTIKRASRTKVLCGCLRNENHSEWETSASSLASGYGCNACGREKSVKSANLSRSIPKTHEESLSSIAKNILERKPAGSKFIRLLEETDMRKEDRLKKSSGRYAIWSCTKCNDEFTAKIYNVANGTSCPKCSRPGSTEKNVISFLRETFTDVQVQQPIGNYFVDARVLCDSTGVYVDIEIDGSQHYERTHVPWYSKLELEEQIARDVEKMRRSASSFIPTVRIPTCAVTRDSRENEEPWKNSLVASIREAAFAAKNSMKRGFIEHEDVMFVVEGHVEKYEAHSVLLKCAFSGGKSVYFGDMLLTTENT